MEILAVHVSNKTFVLLLSSTWYPIISFPYYVHDVPYISFFSPSSPTGQLRCHHEAFSLPRSAQSHQGRNHHCHPSVPFICAHRRLHHRANLDRNGLTALPSDLSIMVFCPVISYRISLISMVLRVLNQGLLSLSAEGGKSST